MLRELGPDDLRPGVLEAHGGDIERVRARVIQAYLDPTMKFMTMLTRSVKIASVLGLMCWHVLRFDEPRLAYSSVAILMNWIDRSDESDLRLPSSAATEMNALTIAQADTELMHMLGHEPEQASAPHRPVSRLVERSYGREAMRRSVRRALAQRFIERVRNRTHVHNVEVLVEVPSAVAGPRADKVA